MPNFRRRRPKGVRRRKRRPRRRLRMSRRIALDPERKVKDTTIGLFSVASVGSSFFLNGVAQGSNINQRQGMQQLGLSQLVTYTLTVNQNFSQQEVRIALVLYKQPNQVNIFPNHVYDGLGTDAAVISHRFLQHALKFKVLWSRTHRLTVEKQTVVATVMRNFRIKTRWANAQDGAGDILTGGLYLIAMASTGTVADQPTMMAECRYRFVG